MKEKIYSSIVLLLIIISVIFLCMTIKKAYAKNSLIRVYDVENKLINILYNVGIWKWDEASSATTIRSLDTATVTNASSGYLASEVLSNNLWLKNDGTFNYTTGSCKNTQVVSVEYFDFISSVNTQHAHPGEERGPDGTGALNLTFNITGYDITTRPTGTVNTVLSGGNFDSWTVTITEKGKLLPKEGEEQRITLSITGTDPNDYNSYVSTWIMGLAHGVNKAVFRGVSCNSATPVITFKAPVSALSPGSTSKTAAVLTFTTDTASKKATTIYVEAGSNTSASIKKTKADLLKLFEKEGQNINRIREDW